LHGGAAGSHGAACWLQVVLYDREVLACDVQVWFKNRRAKCRQIQKAGEQQQQQVVKNSTCSTQLTNGSGVAATGLESASVKQRSSSACSSTDSRADSPAPIKFNCTSMAAAGTGNGCSRSPTSGAELDRASGDGSPPSVSPPAAGSYCRGLPGSPPSPTGVLLQSARPSCLAASTRWPSTTPRDVISCNGFGYRQTDSAVSARDGVTSYGAMAMSPNGNGFYSNHGGSALVGPGYGYGDVGGPAASYGYYGNGVGALEQWQWTTSMARSYCMPGDQSMSGHLFGCGAPGGQGGTARYVGMDVSSYLPQSNVRQLADPTDSDVDDRKDWYRFHAL